MKKQTTQRLIYPLELIRTGITFLRNSRRSNGWSYDPLRALLVYNIIPVDKGYLPVNRDYKPLGIQPIDWYDYNAFSFLIIPDDKVNIENLEFKGELTKSYYLFDDRTYPDCKKNKERYIKVIKETFSDLEPYL